MKATKGDAEYIKNTIKIWKRDGLLSPNDAERLIGSIEIIPFDWNRLAKYSFWISIIFFITSAISLLADDFVRRILIAIFNSTALGKCNALGIMAYLLYNLGYRKRKTEPHNYYKIETIFFLGVFTTAASIYYLGVYLDDKSGHFSILLLLSFIIYGVISILVNSEMIWIFALLSFAGWYGAETGYLSKWQPYYFGMNYALRYVFLGLMVIGCSYGMRKNEKLKPFHESTFTVGLLYVFIPLWILSIIGNNDLRYFKKEEIELYCWSAVLAMASIIACFHALRQDNKTTRSLGIIFFVINIYTRFIDLYWNLMHRSIFFAIFGASLWFLGSKAEKIWHLGNIQYKEKLL